MKIGKDDKVRNTLIVAASAVPVVGGPLAVILDKYLPNEYERRKLSLIENIAADLKLLEERVGKLKIDSPEFISTFMKVLRHCLEEHRDEKIAAFRNVLVNTLDCPEAPFNERDFYIRLVDTLSVDQIRILSLFYKRDIQGSLSFGKDNNVYTYLKKAWPDMDKHYRSACLTELMRFFIVTSSDEVKRERGQSGHLVTDFGLRFIKFVCAPIEIQSCIQGESDGS